MSLRQDILEIFQLYARRRQRAGCRDRDEIVAGAIGELKSRGLVGSEVIDLLYREFLIHNYHISSLREAKKARRDLRELGSEPELPFFAEEDMEIQETLHFDSADELVRLGDFTLKEVDQKTRQVERNIEIALEARRDWYAATEIVRPLLITHPTWTWKDAVEHLKVPS
jgi:hypothetical protein